MSLLLPLAILSLSAIAAPITGWAPQSNGNEDFVVPTRPGLHPGFWPPRELTTVSGTSLVSSTSATDSLLTGTNLDTGLSSTLQSLGTTDLASYPYLGSWFSSDDLASSLGAGGLGQTLKVTSLVVRTGEDPEAWLCIPDGETSSQAATDLESSSWVLLDDLVCGLTQNTFVSVQSVLVYQADGFSDAVVYVPLADIQSTMNTLHLDHSLDSFLYTDIVGVSSDLGLGNNPNAASPLPENPSSDTYLDASTDTETDLWASNYYLGTDTNLVADDTSALPTSTSSSLDLATDSVDTSLSCSLDVDLASNPSGVSGFGDSSCS